MAAWLIAAIERLPSHVRRFVVVLTAVLLLAGAITSLALETSPRGRGRRLTHVAPARSHPALPRPLSPRVSPPVSAADLWLAGGIARRFLLSYLKFAYGRARATSVEAVMPGLRGQLMRDRAQVTPAERARRPRVVLLGVVGTNPGFVLATASVEDGGVAAYRLRLALRKQGGRWLVSDVQEG